MLGCSVARNAAMTASRNVARGTGSRALRCPLPALRPMSSAHVYRRPPEGAGGAVVGRRKAGEKAGEKVGAIAAGASLSPRCLRRPEPDARLPASPRPRLLAVSQR